MEEKEEEKGEGEEEEWAVNEDKNNNGKMQRFPRPPPLLPCCFPSLCRGQRDFTSS